MSIKGLLSTEFQSLGKGPLDLTFTNSSRNGRTLYLSVDGKKSKQVIPGQHSATVYIASDGEVQARQNVGNEILFQEGK